MPPLDEVLREGVPVAALGALLAVAYRHPSERVEALVGLTAAGLTLAVGAVGLDGTWTALRHLAPVVAFLATILTPVVIGAAVALGTSSLPGPTPACGWPTPPPCCSPSPT